jgi:hypothetical protein
MGIVWPDRVKHDDIAFVIRKCTDDQAGCNASSIQTYPRRDPSESHFTVRRDIQRCERFWKKWHVPAKQ